MSTNAKATHIFFCKNISIYAIFNDQNFNNTLTNNMVEQLGPGFGWMAYQGEGLGCPNIMRQSYR